MNRTVRAVHIVLSCGLSYLIPAARSSRLARYVLILMLLNELRGLYFVYLLWDQLPWAK